MDGRGGNSAKCFLKECRLKGRNRKSEVRILGGAGVRRILGVPQVARDFFFFWPGAVLLLMVPVATRARWCLDVLFAGRDRKYLVGGQARVAGT